MKGLRAIGIFLSVFLISGCVSLISRLVTSEKDIQIPRIVAHLEPGLKENKIFISGKIVTNNPTGSVLELEKVFITIKDEDNNILADSILEWKGSSLKSHDELSSSVALDLDLSILNKDHIDVILKTGFIYKKLGLRIPIEDKIAVLHLSALKESIKRPLNISVSTKFYPDLSGNIHAKYVLGITNPVGIDLLLQDGAIEIYSSQKDEAIKAFLSSVLFKSEAQTKIEGFIQFGKTFGAMIVSDFVKDSPVHVKVTGKLRLPDTDIFMPFEIETVQELDFSLFRIGRK